MSDTAIREWRTNQPRFFCGATQVTPAQSDFSPLQTIRVDCPPDGAVQVITNRLGLFHFGLGIGMTTYEPYRPKERTP